MNDYTENYRIAEKVIRVNSLYERVHDYCKAYRSEESPDFEVTISQSDIDVEREKSAGENRSFPEDYLEELAVYRKIAENMLDHDTLLFHGSVIAVEGKGFLFTAKSGTGKSTHTGLWREVFGDRAVMVNDDKPLLRITEQEVTVFGTPYNGKHRLGNNISVPLKGLCLLTRSESNTIRKITKTEAYPMLIQQAYRPEDGQKLKKVLQLIDVMCKKVNLYRLGCNMEKEAALVAYEGMKG